MFKNLTAKDIFIIVLSCLLLISIFFRRSNKIDDYKTQIDVLKNKNKQLFNQNDSLKTINKKIDWEIKILGSKLEEMNKIILDQENKINNLEKRRNEVPSRVNVLSADGVATELTDYLKKR